MAEEMKNATAKITAEPTPANSVPNPMENEVFAKLTEYGLGRLDALKIMEDLGVESLEDLASLEVSDLTGAGMKLAKARKLVAELKNASKPAPAVAAAETRAIQTQFESLLPSIPTDDSWLNALKTGGILKVDESSYIAAIRAALADRAGLYAIPDALAKAMEKYADETEEQVDPTFYALRKSLTRRAYGDIFAAIDGLDGTFITEARRKEFLSRIRETLWPAIAESYRTLDGWYQTWRASFSDPSMLIAAISGGFGGGAAGMSMITPPDTAQLHDAGDTLVDSINRVFRGTGVQVAAAMAYDANTIRNTLEDPRLPSMVGVKNREMMLKKIGASVSSNYVRLEQNLVKYVLAFAKHDTVTSDVEVNYFVALWQLGTQINWGELGGGDVAGMTGLTGKRVL
ncbi:hypothetical protein IKT18_02300 [Candidatus Saccharibacteria bacterium]|nr:hypothetical protein [Candidatus Saccharibacteria bacterium]